MTTTTPHEHVTLTHHRSYSTGHTDGWTLAVRPDWAVAFHRAIGFARNVLAYRDGIDPADAYVAGLFDGMHDRRAQ